MLGRTCFLLRTKLRRHVEGWWPRVGSGRCRAGQDPGSSTFSNARTSASLVKWVSRWSTAMPPCSAAAAAIRASVSGTRWYPSLCSASSPIASLRRRRRRDRCADAEPVEFHLERDVLGAAASGVEDLHSYDRGDPQTIANDRSCRSSSLGKDANRHQADVRR